MIFVKTVSVKITLKVAEVAKMQFIFVILSRSVFPSAEKTLVDRGKLPNGPMLAAGVVRSYN